MSRDISEEINDWLDRIYGVSEMTTREDKKEGMKDYCGIYGLEIMLDKAREFGIAEGKRIAVERYIHHNDTYANDWYIDWEKEMLGDLSTKKWEDGEM